MPETRIVSIEDESDMIELIRLILVRRGYIVVSANGGREGLRVVAAIKPDLVLLDLMMPDMDGWEVYARLKDNDATKSIPVIIVTARAQYKERLIAIHETGVDDYIIKPFGPAQLVEMVERILTREA
ncbi:MAG: response regulator [Chloroflexota bacterium]|nr:response regulator [Chloroflexota bacterium]